MGDVAASLSSSKGLFLPSFLSRFITMESLPYVCDLEITFPNAKHAEIVKRTLEVDKELNDDRVTKKFSLQQGSNESLVVLHV